jgi:deoxyribose-phosphate aldolase
MMQLAACIDHTILKADCTSEDIRRMCAEAQQFQFAAVCIPSFYVGAAADWLAHSSVKIATVVGFPMGYSPTPAKVEEVKRAIDDGAHEVDAVINLCAVKSGNWNYVRNDIDSMVMAAHLKGKTIKIILETGLLTEMELQQLARICLEIRPDFVKTSTGFNGEGATVQVVQTLKHLLHDHIKIKASGGIRTKADALRLLEAGAKRIGSSSSVMIINEG